jgi:hypothetical protein
MSRLAWAVILLSAALASAQQQTIEITKTDFTKVDGVRSTSLSVFGIKLGESRKEAQASAASFGVQLSPKQEQHGVTFKSASGCEVVVNFDDDAASRITLRENCAEELAGESRHLLEPGITWPSSEERLKLLGREDRAENNSLGYGSGKTELLVYEKEGLQIGNFYDNKKDSITLHLVAPAKNRS